LADVKSYAHTHYINTTVSCWHVLSNIRKQNKARGNLYKLNGRSTCATISKCSKFFCRALAFCNDLPITVFLLRNTVPWLSSHSSTCNKTRIQKNVNKNY